MRPTRSAKRLSPWYIAITINTSKKVQREYQGNMIQSRVSKLVLSSGATLAVLLVALTNTEPRALASCRVRDVRAFIMLNVARPSKGGSNVLELVRAFDNEALPTSCDGRGSSTTHCIRLE